VSETSLPRTMRASVLHAPGKLVVEERPVPVPGPREVLVEVGSVGVCGSDVHYYEHGRIGDFVVREPLVLGHEAGGRIISVGEGVEESRVGERVALEPGVPCRRCAHCRTGRYNLCPDVRFLATPPVDGAFCEYVVMPDDFAYPVPDSVSDDAAGLIEPLSVGVWANRTARVRPGGSLLVAGAGPIGLLVAQVARALGVSEVVVTDLDPGRRALAGRMGATTVLDPGAGDDPRDAAPAGGFDAFVDCTGAPPAVRSGMPAVRPAGVVVLVGMGADELTVPVPLIQNQEITLTGTFRYANTWPTAIGLAAGGAVDLDALVTGHVDLDHVEDAMRPAPGAVKTVVRPGGVR
jgi:L-iditol 2-dehydrogenase